VKETVIILAALWSAACGVIGSPIAPEDVGVAPLIERQKRLDALDAKQRGAAESQPLAEPQGQDVDLPPLQPVGVR
jgi:hypothetical protein